MGMGSNKNKKNYWGAVTSKDGRVPNQKTGKYKSRQLVKKLVEKHRVQSFGPDISVCKYYNDR